VSNTTKHFDLSGETDVADLIVLINELRTAGKRPVVTVEYGETKRTAKQNRSLHQWFTQVAEGLNDAGLDQRLILSESIPIEWSGREVKERMWKPLQKVVIGEESTANASTTDYTPVYDRLARYLAQTFGYRVPDWPCQESQRREFEERKSA